MTRMQQGSLNTDICEYTVSVYSFAVLLKCFPYCLKFACTSLINGAECIFEIIRRLSSLCIGNIAIRSGPQQFSDQTGTVAVEYCSHKRSRLSADPVH